VFVGIDVHKHSHAVALIDERGGELGALTVANSPEGYRRLLDWLHAHEAERAVVGLESPGSYGRRLVGALAAAGLEVLHVPGWRTHRERHRQGPGKSDPGDALAIADVVRRKRGELSPALEAELVRALALLELQRRRFVRDRTQAIQRLRSDWTQLDPVAEAGVIRCDRQRELRRLKRISFGDGLVEQLAARCIRELARDIEDLNQRIAALDQAIAELLDQHGNPLADLHGAGTNLAASVIAQAGDVRRFRDAAAFARFCMTSATLAAPSLGRPVRRPCTGNANRPVASVGPSGAAPAEVDDAQAFDLITPPGGSRAASEPRRSRRTLPSSRSFPSRRATREADVGNRRRPDLEGRHAQYGRGRLSRRRVPTHPTLARQRYLPTRASLPQATTGLLTHRLGLERWTPNGELLDRTQAVGAAPRTFICRRSAGNRVMAFSRFKAYASSARGA
jgi:transposase